MMETYVDPLKWREEVERVKDQLKKPKINNY